MTRLSAAQTVGKAFSGCVCGCLERSAFGLVEEMKRVPSVTWVASLSAEDLTRAQGG